ncbi:hypothetical protein M2360_004105 [Rhizobium sp. SG_E_25_P2]|uniref:DUF4198 domain-containing protein n=1 Tax=Rhizobium sp. SG_E_25_P2 TaxID=2879942 RepID=UPI002475E165|nr:DUF4198 domain-containing protein [Rhizobium sp. SG_E_25_P2]MDH6268698.1 hypothetical protein [Rhizobium sp. SG_E_25_P2]
MGAVAAILVLVLRPAAAHDFWLQSDDIRPPPGIVIAVNLLVGEHFIGDSLPRPAEGVERFEFLHAGGTSKVMGGSGELPAGLVVMPSSPMGLLTYLGGGASVELSLKDFNRYADAYGLRQAIETAGGWKEAGPFSECFYRYAKSAIGDADAGGLAGQALDWDFEIVLSTLPQANNNDLRGRLLAAGEPVPDALVRLYRQGEPGLELKARSNADGSFVVSLPGPGPWGVMAVTIARAGFFASCDWQSRWASFTFDWRR